jgi:acetoin utilization deacetylase AcuC-like enzyme
VALVIPATRRTGWVWEPAFAQHDAALDFGPWVAPGAAFESPAGKQRFADLVAVSGLIDALVPLRVEPVTDADLRRVHAPDYIARVQALSAGGGGDAGDYCHVGSGSFEIAQLAAGGTVAAVAAVLDGSVHNAYALVRPAGHHAEAGRGRGYCIFGNIAVAITKARAELGLGRVAVVDWDVHHGNGTEDMFRGDPGVLTISLHQDHLYPEDSGSISSDRSVINVPLPPGCGFGAYADAFERVVLPALRAHRPELIVVASGFDSGGFDPMGRMLLSSSAFARLTGLLMEAADDLCDGRLVLSHEGGYSELHVPFCGLAVLEQLSGARTDVEDPLAWIDEDPYQALAPHQSAVVDDVAAARPH